MSAPSTLPLIVRHARLDDSIALHAVCFPEQPLEWVTDYLAWCLAAPERPTRLVALLDEVIVAHAELMPRQNGAWAELSALTVAGTRRGEGIGPRLVRAVVRVAQRWGCGEVRLQVEADAAVWLEVYQRWGLAPRGAPLAGRRWLAIARARSPPPARHAPARRVPSKRGRCRVRILVSLIGWQALDLRERSISTASPPFIQEPHPCEAYSKT